MFEIKPKKFKRILVGVDDAPDARAAFSYAVDKAKRDGSEIGIDSILEYVQAAIDYGVDPKKITAIVDHGERPAERICNHVIPAFQPDLLVVGSIGKWGNRKAVGSQASYMTRHAGTSVFVIRTTAVQTYE